MDKTTVIGIILTFALVVASQAQLVISEIMYNPASSDSDWEWIEIVNTGNSAVNLNGYVLDDLAGAALDSANIAGGTIQAGGTAVLFDSSNDVLSLEAVWGVGINWIEVTNWGALNNTGDTIGLWDSFSSYAGKNFDNAETTLTYTDSSPFPVDDGSSSIYLTALGDLNDGANWSLSVAGVDGAFTGVEGVNNNIGSPGITTIPEPSILGMIGIGIAVLAGLRKVRDNF